jgi:hypothetical protein
MDIKVGQRWLHNSDHTLYLTIVKCTPHRIDCISECGDSYDFPPYGIERYYRLSESHIIDKVLNKYL